MNNGRALGKIRKLKEGYGFIAGDDGKDYFFHWTAMRKDSVNFRQLQVLDRVSYEIIPNSKDPDKPRAIEVAIHHGI